MLIRRTLKYLGIVIVTVILGAPTSALLYRAWVQHRVSKSRAIQLPKGIESLEAVKIGGIDQWIEIRGLNVNNPILLFIHGGPGVAFIPLSRSFQTAWESEFTVVQWDQRGAGKTYASNHDERLRSTMNVAQMEQDTLELVNYLCNRFHREKIFVVAHSWGSVLGLWLAHEHGELLYAYVGVGQVVNMPQNEKLAYDEALAVAYRDHRPMAKQQLESIAPYPPADFDFQKTSIARTWDERLLGPPQTPESFTNIRRILLEVATAPEYSLADDYGFVQGIQYSIRTMAPQLGKVDLTQMGYDFSEPVFFFEGRQDPDCRPSLVLDYARKLNAPHKDFVWFEHSGHFPFYEESARFSEELIRRVRPLAAQEIGAMPAAVH